MTTRLDDIGVCIGTLGPDPFTIAQDLPPVFAAVAAAGTTSVSIHSFLGMMYGPDKVAGMVSDAGLRAGALEAALAWSKGPGSDNVAEAEGIIAMAEATGARKLLTVVLEPEMDFGAAAEGLAELCRTIDPAGVQVCLEWLPWTAMATIADAHRLALASGEPNCGITFDTWHWVRQPGGPDFDTLAKFRGEQVGYLQLCDAAATPGDDVFAEAMSSRLLPGDGIVDFTGIVATLDAMGADPYVVSEIFNDEVLAGGVAHAARTYHDACLRLAR